MTSDKILEEILPSGLCFYVKARYIKIYKAPTRDVQVF